MFHSPRVNLYESDEGFSVEVLGRTGLRYRENDKSVFVDSEVLLGPSGMTVYKTSIRKWDPPSEEDIIDDAKREHIVENIRRAFRFQGYEVDVIG